MGLFAGLERERVTPSRTKSSSCLMIPSSAHESPRRKVGWPVRKRPFKLPGRFNRLRTLREQRVESEQQLDDAQAELTAAEAGLREAQGLLDLARWQLAWTVIRSPIDGVVLEKLADENELVSPQSFGGDKGRTALLAVADPQDLQVEVDLNESDLSKVWLGQPCRVTPEAYPDHVYDGYVAEIAPEAIGKGNAPNQGAGQRS